ncbi:MAG: hypothetical protein M3347_11805, partial [Armatimonadota bacterium]|nr:hypothetical protein [Armatimonadota bacterium]
EGRDGGMGTVDVIVCDGFVGNVVLKVAEGFAKMFAGALRTEVTRDVRSKIGALILRPALQSFKKRLDYTEYGGAALLGVNGVCIICHGSSDARSIASAIRIARQTVAADIVGTIRAAVERVSAGEAAPDETTPPISSGAVGEGGLEATLEATPAPPESTRVESSQSEAKGPVGPPVPI